METIAYILAYLIVACLFASFGRFMKECDQAMIEQHEERTGQ